MKKVVKIFQFVNGFAASNTSVFEAVFATRTGASNGFQVFNVGPDAAEFSFQAGVETMTTLNVGESVQLPWAAPLTLFVRGNSELNVAEVEFDQ
jgi:hypothetical protein